MSAKFRCSNMDKLRPAASPGISLLIWGRFSELGVVCVGPVFGGHLKRLKLSSLRSHAALVSPMMRQEP